MELINDITNFIDNDIIPNTIEKYFKNLNTIDKNMLKKYYKKIIFVIYYSFFYNNSNFNDFKEKMSINNFSDSTAILLLLLPYINPSEDSNDITSFNDMVKRKYKDTNIKLSSPKYVYTNFQYGRCIRNTIEEINFEEDFLKNNYLFLVNTIKNTSNKLYINWIDIIPYDMINYKSSKLFINTEKYFIEGKLREYDFYNDTDINNDLIKNLSCLNIGDIYETLTNEFYYQIKNVKWLIYDIYIDNLKKPIPLLLVLNQIFGELLWQPSLFDWDDMKKEELLLFEEKWRYLLNLAKTGENFDNGILVISSKNIRKILKALIIFFNNYYKDMENLIERKEYERINFDEIPDDEFEEADEEILENIKFSKIRKILNNIKLEYIYKFIKDSLELLKLSWYSLKLFDKNKRKISHIKKYMEEYNSQITIKNIYNFCKSLCHINYNNKFTQLPRFWQSLTSEQKTIIENRFYDMDQNIMDWFNISRNLKQFNLTNILEYHESIFNYMRNNIIEFVFESLISRGILSKLVPALDLAKKIKNIPIDKRSKFYPEYLKDKVFSTNESNKIWTDSYYYLTSTTYQYMNPIEYNNRLNKKIQTNYFNWNSSEDSGSWYAAYALDWICQINFFNKFINNRVMYVTGATGAGKSTQVPKLLLYAQKALLYNSTSHIVCTQPRKTPTTNNADRVSLEMGVPLSTELKKNYYVQFKHKDAKHIKNTNHLSLKFVTDGSLGMEINNPVLRKEPYYTQNLYDIVIIDEAHEHNANMDMILSLMKYIALYNNTLKLVIVSATMDDDEPTYRRYYRDINDNKMYPLNYYLEKHNLDRINVDRRFHMSPPGKTTRYDIKDIYLENINTSIQDPINLALNIIKNSQTGFILIFQPGVGEIENMIIELNKKLPDDVIAIPYHSLLKKNIREFVEKIDSNYTKLALEKHIKFSDLANPEDGPYMGKYKRIVIVATNIAEASITINNLKYVIETGTQKTAIYDYSKRNTSLKIKTISDSSRLQRRGRVGRVAPGDVYYLYKKGTTENIKTIYNICIQDISLELYKRLYKNSNEKVLLYIDNDPNNPKNKINYDDLKIKYDKFDLNFIYYFNLNNYFTYFGNTKHYDYNNYENISYYYENGYSINNLNDYNGKFFIIHPEEIDLVRNITGIIIENKNKSNILKNNLLTSKKLEVFWESLKNDYFLDYNNDQIFKLELGNKFTRLQEIFSFEDPKLFKIFLYSYVFGVQEEVFRIICLLQVITRYTDSFLQGYILNGKFVKPIDEVKKYVGECRGDLEAILIILNYYHQKLDSSGVEYDKDFNLLDSKIFITQASKYIKEHDNIISREAAMKQLNLNIKDTNFFSYLDKENYMNLRKSDKFIDFALNSFDDKSNEILDFCKKYYLNFLTLRNYYEKYCSFKNIIYLYNNKELDDVKMEEYGLLNELVDYLSKNLKSKSFNKYDKIISCFILANPYNLVSNITGTNNFIYLYEPTRENIYKLSTITQYNKKLDNLVNPIYLSKYIYYHNLDIDKESISIVNNVDPKILENLNNIYNLNDYNNKLNNLLKQDYIPKNNVYSSNYKNKLKEIISDISISNKADTSNEKIEFFNRKIKEIMS